VYNFKRKGHNIKSKFFASIGNSEQRFERYLVQRQSRSKVCNILYIPSLLYGSEICTFKQRVQFIIP